MNLLKRGYKVLGPDMTPLYDDESFNKYEPHKIYRISFNKDILDGNNLGYQYFNKMADIVIRYSFDTKYNRIFEVEYEETYHKLNGFLYTNQISLIRELNQCDIHSICSAEIHERYTHSTIL